MTIPEIRDNISALYEEWSLKKPESLIELPLSGSNRKYFRITKGEKSIIATYNGDVKENEAFFHLQAGMKSAGVNVPEVYFIDSNRTIYFQEDLGDINLYGYLKEGEGQAPENLLSIYKKIIEQMPLIQEKVVNSIDFSKCYPRSDFDRQSIQWDLNYFKYNFLKLVKFPFDEQKLEDDFQVLINLLLEAEPNYFLYRDFQSRNIMVKDDEVYFIDFQGGRRGARQYDLASLLFESKVNLSKEQRDILFNYYLDVNSKNSSFNRESFVKYYSSFAMVRLLQAFGAYGYRGIFEKKVFFVKSIIQGLINLEELASDKLLSKRLPYLCELIGQMQSLKSKFLIPDYAEKLLVTITSFSYKQNIPDDWSGNGGGFVFDCRGLPNPGRLEEYKALTGRDRGVVEFLERENAVEDYVLHARGLVEQSVKEYIKRGFNNLSVSFGCTGGQHRSVYMSEQLARYLRLNFNVDIRLIHREQNIDEFYGQNNVQKE